MLWLQDGRLYILICHLISVSLESTVYMYHVHLNLCRETLTNLHIHHSFAIEIPSSLTTSQGPWNCQVSGGEQEVRQVWASLGTWDLNKIMASTSYLARKFAGSTYPATQFEASTTPTDHVATMDIKCLGCLETIDPVRFELCVLVAAGTAERFTQRSPKGSVPEAS